MMSLIKGLFGWAGGALVLIAALILGADLNEFTHSGVFYLSAIDDLWTRFDADSLAAVLTFVHNTAGENIANLIIRAVFEGAAFYVAAAFGLVFLLISWMPKGKGDRKMSALHREVHYS